MAKKNIWDDASFEKITADLSKTIVNSNEPQGVQVRSVKKRNTSNLSKEAKRVTKWRDDLKDIIKKPMMIEKHIHIRMKRYCVDKEINIFDYTCDLIDRDLKKHNY